MALPSSLAMRYIYRYPTGWAVRYSPCNDWAIDTKSKFFSDKKYAGKENALKAAKKYRNSVIDLSTITESRHIMNRHDQNTSGIIGVRIGIRDYVWEADGYVNKVHWRRGFSINKYGNKTAFLMACRARYKAHGTLHIHCKMSELPCRPDVPFIEHRKKK